jgi:hypothetical protein
MASRPRLARALLAAVVPLLLPTLALADVAWVSLKSYANFETAGLLVTVAGDASRQASAAIEIRKSTEPDYRLQHPAVRVDATHFVGSVFGLAEGTSYDVRVTLSEPNGARPIVKTASFVTRTAMSSVTRGRTFKVGPGRRFSTIQAAVDAATKPGDTVLVYPGTYREKVTVAHSGTRARPIVIRAQGDGAMLDGGRVTGPLTWTNEGELGYSTMLADVHGVVADQGRLFQYNYLYSNNGSDELASLSAGGPGGYHYEDGKLWVKFADGSSPALHELHIGGLIDNAFTLDGSYVIVDGFEIAYYGMPVDGAIHINGDNDVVRRCNIHENSRTGVLVKGGNGLIEENYIWDTSIWQFDWNSAKGSTAENNTIEVAGPVGRGNVIRNNVLSGTFDCIGTHGELKHPEKVTTELDIHGNHLSFCSDDTYEIEGHQSNVRIFDNVGEFTHMGLSVTPAHVGPVFFIRNIVWNYGAALASQRDGWRASGIKVNFDENQISGQTFVYHNTFYTTEPGTRGIVLLLEPGRSHGLTLRNNIISSPEETWFDGTPMPVDLDYDGLYNTSAIFASWFGVDYPDYASWQAATGQEAHAIAAFGVPEFVDAAAGNFGLPAGSPLRDKAVRIPGINDAYEGAAPDIGAIEGEGQARRP